MQVSAYKHAMIVASDEPAVVRLEKVDTLKLAILQVGYRGNRTKTDGSRTMWKFTEVEDKFQLFLAVQEIWKSEAEGESPSRKDYPLVLTLTPPSPAKPEPTVANSVRGAKKTV